MKVNSVLMEFYKDFSSMRRMIKNHVAALVGKEISGDINYAIGYSIVLQDHFNLKSRLFILDYRLKSQEKYKNIINCNSLIVDDYLISSILEFICQNEHNVRLIELYEDYVFLDSQYKANYEYLKNQMNFHYGKTAQGILDRIKDDGSC